VCVSGVHSWYNLSGFFYVSCDLENSAFWWIWKASVCVMSHYPWWTSPPQCTAVSCRIIQCNKVSPPQPSPPRNRPFIVEMPDDVFVHSSLCAASRMQSQRLKWLSVFVRLTQIPQWLSIEKHVSANVEIYILWINWRINCYFIGSDVHTNPSETWRRTFRHLKGQFLRVTGHLHRFEAG